MVYPDIYSNKNEAAESENIQSSIASIPDRCFSFLIDYLVISPFVSFLMYIFYKNEILYWKMNPIAPEKKSILFILVISYVLLFSFFQTLFILYNRATPGQYYLKLFVHFETKASSFLLIIFLRQILFWFSFLFLGIPWLYMLANKKQNAFYEKITDSVVLSKKRIFSKTFFSSVEHQFWNAFAHTMTLFLIFIFSGFFYYSLESIEQRTASYNLYEKQNHFCSEIKNVVDSSRLQLAIALNLAGQLSDTCLDKEADFVLWKLKSDEISLAYYAKSLTEKNKDLEGKYLQQACLDYSSHLNNTKENYSLGCQLATAKFPQSTDLKLNQLAQSLSKNNDLLARVIDYEIAVKLNIQDQIIPRLSKLKKFEDHLLIKKYILSEIVNGFSVKKNSKLEKSRSVASIDNEDALNHENGSQVLTNEQVKKQKEWALELIERF